MSENEPELKKGYTWRFYAGVLLAVLNLPLGWLGMFLFVYDLDNLVFQVLGASLYVLSWGVLFIGLWIVGKEYADKVKRYVNYKFYHESLKKGTAKMMTITKEKTAKFRKNTHLKSQALKEKARKHTLKVKSRVKKHLSKVKVRSPFRKRR